MRPSPATRRLPTGDDRSPVRIQAARADLPDMIKARIETPGLVAEVCDLPVIASEEETVCEVEHILSLSLLPVPLESTGCYEPGPRSSFTRFGRLHLRLKDMPLRYRIVGGRMHTVRLRFDGGWLETLVAEDGRWTEAQLAACLDIRRPALEDLMLRLAGECLSPGLASPIMVEGVGLSIVVELARHLVEARRRSEHVTAGLSSWQLRRISQRVEDDVASTPSLSELADLCEVSPRHLMRAYKQSTGRTVAKYVESVRISQAKTLLIDRAAPVRDVAQQLGYSSASAFSAAFRRAAGMTPRAYRRQVR